VHVVSYESPFRLRRCQPEVLFHAVEMPSYPLFHSPPYVLAVASKLAELARYEGLDLVHAHYAVPHSAAAALAREIARPLDLPFVVTLHGTDVTLFGRDESLRPALVWSLRQASAVTAVSDHLAAAARDAFGLQDVRRIYNFVDPWAWQADGSALRARYARPGEAVLVHVSNFRPVKNLAGVVRVFSEVARRRPARLLLVGDGPDAGTARRMARDLGQEARVHFLGAYEDVAEVLAAADVFLLPSQDESFGLGALEAMASGVPVVASRVGGLPEVVVDGVTGFLCPPDDVEAMAEASLRLLADLDRFRAAASRHAAERFPAPSIVPQYEALYGEVLAASARR
jgi:N-acetyl-alpha-D-glucosaminyl L-malate synthase BshA